MRTSYTMLSSESDQLTACGQPSTWWPTISATVPGAIAGAEADCDQQRRDEQREDGMAPPARGIEVIVDERNLWRRGWALRDGVGHRRAPCARGLICDPRLAPAAVDAP